MVTILARAAAVPPRNRHAARPERLPARSPPGLPRLGPDRLDGRRHHRAKLYRRRQLRGQTRQQAKRRGRFGLLPVAGASVWHAGCRRVVSLVERLSPNAQSGMRAAGRLDNERICGTRLQSNNRKLRNLYDDEESPFPAAHSTYWLTPQRSLHAF